MEKFVLSLHPDKTRLIEFGRYAAEHRVRRGLGKPETFNFLGFTHICGRSSRGVFQLKRQTRRDRMRTRLRAIKEELQRRMHEPIPLQGKWLRQVVRGYFAYHAVPTNCKALSTFRHYVMNLWRRALQRRSQRDRSTWERIAQLAREFLPLPRILHPWPSARFARQIPKVGARCVNHARRDLCGGCSAMSIPTAIAPANKGHSLMRKPPTFTVPRARFGPGAGNRWWEFVPMRKRRSRGTPLPGWRSLEQSGFNVPIKLARECARVPVISAHPLRHTRSLG